MKNSEAKADAGLKIEYVPIDSIKPYARNAKQHPPEQVREIVYSIKTVGFRDPIGVWRGEIVEGHGRYMAARELGMETVPVIRLDDMTDDQRRAYMLIHNKTTMDSDFDRELLDFELGEIELDMEPFGFDLGEEDAEPQEAVEDDYDPEPPKEPKAKRGDIYQLGRHRLMCGDSTDAEEVDRLMDGKRADICFTSPPYNAMAGFNANKGMSNPYMKEGGVYEEYSDDLDAPSYAEFLSNALQNALANCDDALFNIGNTKGALCGTALFLGENANLFSGCLYWEKSNAFIPQFAVQHGVMTNIVEPVYLFNGEGQRKVHHATWEKHFPNLVKSENAAGNENAAIHGATFPVSFAAQIIANFSEKSVLDLFGGTGTTLIAAQQLDRDCFMMEISPHYIDVIIDRWEKFTGEKAALLNRVE